MRPTLTDVRIFSLMLLFIFIISNSFLESDDSFQDNLYNNGINIGPWNSYQWNSYEARIPLLATKKVSKVISNTNKKKLEETKKITLTPAIIEEEKQFLKQNKTDEFPFSIPTSRNGTYERIDPSNSPKPGRCNKNIPIADCTGVSRPYPPTHRSNFSSGGDNSSNLTTSNVTTANVSDSSTNTTGSNATAKIMMRGTYSNSHNAEGTIVSIGSSEIPLASSNFQSKLTINRIVINNTSTLNYTFRLGNGNRAASSSYWSANDTHEITINHTFWIDDLSPSANFSYFVNQSTITFIDISSSPYDNVTSYFWDFGDETNSTLRDVNHTYNRTGNYSVYLTVTDSDGSNNSRSTIISITGITSSSIAKVIIMEDANETRHFLEGSTITIGSATIPLSSEKFQSRLLIDDVLVFSTNSTGYAYNLGNGPDTKDISYWSSNLTHEVFLNYTLVIDDQAPTANFTVVIANGTAFLIDNSSSLYDNITSYFWDFGDGNNNSLRNVNHTYNISGNYTILHSVRDSDGSYDHENRTINISVPTASSPAGFNQASLDGLKNFTNITFTYDANGNLLQDGQQTYEYDTFNRLSIVRSQNTSQVVERYFYTGDGQRIKKVSYFSGREEVTYYLGNLVRENGVDNIYIFYDGQLVGAYENNTKVFYHTDNLGSVDTVTDVSGNIIQQTSYAPFGAVIFGGNSSYLYTGKERDSTGLMYYESRYYHPLYARFTQPDSIVQNIYDPQSLNSYAYARNNPYKYTDPSGHNPLLLSSLIGGIIGAGIDMIRQIWNGASLFDGSMDWRGVGKSALIGAGAGLVGGTTWGVGEAAGLTTGIVGGASWGAASGTMAGRAAQLVSNIIYDETLTNEMLDGDSMAADAVIGGFLGGVSSIFSSRATSSSINLNSGEVQEFQMNKLYGTHQLQKEDVLTAKKIHEGPKKGPIEIYNYEGNLIISEGMGRTAREYLLKGKTSVKGTILNANPSDIPKQKVAADMYKWKNSENMLEQLKKLK